MFQIRALVLGCALAVLVGCNATPKNVEYARSFQQTVEDFEAVRDKAAAPWSRISEVSNDFANDYGELSRQLSQESQIAENSARSLKSEFDRMLNAANDLFSSWEQKVNEIENLDTRAREMEHLDQRRQEYEKVLNDHRVNITQLDDALRDVRDTLRVIEIRQGEQELKGKIGEIGDIASRARDIVNLLKNLTVKGRELAATASD